MNISFSLLTDPGPRPFNEDSVDCWVDDDGTVIACVADGLGGMGGGETASKLALHEFRDHLTEVGISSKTLSEAALKAHRKIREVQAASKESSLANMATTLTAVAISGTDLLGIHCGDSRAAIARKNGIKKLTTDHSEGQRLFSSGKLSKNELVNYPRKHILESALGTKEEPSIDFFVFDLLLGDQILLTTDGVHNIIPLREMQRLSSTFKKPTELTQRVSESMNQLGATDNFSMIALYVE